MNTHNTMKTGCGRGQRRWRCALAPVLAAGLIPGAMAQEATDEASAPAAGYYYNGWTGHLSHGLRDRDPRGFASLWWDRRFASGWGIGTGLGSGERVRGTKDYFLMVRGRHQFGPVAALGGLQPRIGLETGLSFYLGPASAWSLMGSIGLGTPDSQRVGVSIDLLGGVARSERARIFEEDEDVSIRARPLVLRFGLTFRH